MLHCGSFVSRFRNHGRFDSTQTYCEAYGSVSLVLTKGSIDLQKTRPGINLHSVEHSDKRCSKVLHMNVQGNCCYGVC